MRAFRAEGDDLVAEVEPGERQVLATVVADVADLLGAGRLEDRARSGAPDGDTARHDGLRMRLRLDPLPTPGDPAVHRLLPDASRDDAEVAAEFRRLTEDDLRQRKIERLAELYDLLTADAAANATEPDTADATLVRVPRDRAPELAATLTDLRLVLGERLGVSDDDASERLEGELVQAVSTSADRAAQVRQYLGSVFLALGWWQETLMAYLLAELDARPDTPEGAPGLGSGS